MKNNGIIFLLALLCLKTTAQVTGEVNVLDRDAFYLQYTPPYIMFDDMGYQRYSGKLNIPPIRKGRLSVFNTLGADLHHFNHNNDSSAYRNTHMQTVYNLNVSVFAQYKFSDTWSLNALIAPFLATRFNDNVSLYNLNFNGNFYAERSFYLRSGGYLQAALGVAYVTLNGTTALVPVTHLKARPSEEWSFVIGLPNTYLKWDVKPKHSLKALVDLNDISTPMDLSAKGTPIACKAVFTIVSAGLEYNYWVTPSVGVMLRATHTIWDNYELRDANNTAQYRFDSYLPHSFVSVGIKFNPIRELQNSIKPL